VEPRTDPAAAQAAAPGQATPERKIDYVGQGKALIEKCIAEAASNHARLLRDRADILNQKFDRGGRANQWCVWDQGTGRYVERGTDPEQGGLPEYIPRPVTNVFNVVIDGICAILDQSEPAQVFGPNTDADSDKAAAEVAADAVPVLREECGYDSEGHRHELNRLSTLIDKCLYLLYYDNDPKHGMGEVELFSCGQCGEVVEPMEVEDAGGKCPHCEYAETEHFELVTDPTTALPITIPMPKGRIRGEIIPSYEFTLPSSCRRPNAKAAPWILTHSRMAPQDVARMWPAAAAIADDKSKWASGSLTRAYADQMRALSSPATGETGSRTGSQEVDGPVVYRLMHDPIEDRDFYFPKGFFGVLIGGELVEKGPLPFEDGNGTPVKHGIVRTYVDGTGSQFGHPPGDDLVPLQQSRNLVESMIQLIIMHDAAPTKYLPETVTLVDQPTGVPGEWVRYRSLDGQKPTESRGMNPPESLFNYLDRIDAKFQEVSRLNSVLSGQRPSGDPTLGEVQILEERGMAAFRAPLDCLIQFEKDLSFLLLTIARQCAWSPRFRRIRGEDKQWEIKQFASADLSGEIDITVARASAWPKSPLMQQLRIKEALSGGVLPPPMQDPELQGQLLVDMDLAHLKKSWDVDRRQIARELDVWRHAHTPDEIMAAAPDPHIIEISLHLYLKKNFLKTEEAEEIRLANPPVYQAMVQQVLGLEQHMQMKAMQAAAIQAGPQTPAAPGGEGALDAALEAGAVAPAEEPQPEALAAAMESGALMPAGAGEAMAAAAAAGPSMDDLLEAKLLLPVTPDEGAAHAGVPPL